MSVWGAVASGIATLVGNRQKGQINSLLAKDQRSWEEQMSATAYRRAMKDMKLAGLNPILAYQKGPASTPSGASASIGGGDLGASVASGMQAGTAASMAKTQQKNIDMDTLKKREEMLLVSAQAAETMEREKLNRELQRQAAEQAERTREERKAVGYENERRKAEAELFKTEMGRKLRALGIIRDNVSGMIPFTGGSSARRR